MSTASGVTSSALDGKPAPVASRHREMAGSYTRNSDLSLPPRFEYLRYSGANIGSMPPLVCPRMAMVPVGANETTVTFLRPYSAILSLNCCGSRCTNGHL